MSVALTISANADIVERRTVMLKKLKLEVVVQFLSVFSLLIGSVIIIFVGAILIFAGIGFVFGYSINAGVVWGSAIASIFYTAWGTTRYFKRKRLVQFAVFAGVLLVVCLIFAASMVLAGYFYDLSWDGLWYHASAIIQLIKGWNPLRDPPLSGTMTSGNVIGAPIINYYTKGPWIVSAALFKVTGNIEQSKAVNLLLCAASFFLSFSALLSLKGLKLWLALILSVILALNPVVIYQAISFYVDGQLASLLTCLVFLLILLSQYSDKTYYLMLGVILVLTINIKSTGLAFAAILCGGFFLWHVFFQKKDWKRLAAVGFMGSLIGVALVGYNPYITNTLNHKWSTAYQLAGISYHTPPNLRGMNPIGQLLISLFAESSHTEGSTKAKFPFAVSQEDLHTFQYPDARVGGFGPLFGGVILLTIILLILTLLSSLRKKTSKKYIYLLVLGLIVLSIFVSPATWFARYIPQLWVLPVLVIIFAISDFRSYQPTNTILCGLLLVTLSLNCLLVFQPQVRYQYRTNAALKQQLAKLAHLSSPVQVQIGEFVGIRFRYEERGIKYIEVQDLNCKNPQHLANIPDTLFCEK